MASDPTKYWCWFCGKRADFVRVLVTAPRACICDECVDLAAEIVADSRAKKRAPPDLSPPIGLTQAEKMPGTEKKDG